MPAGRPRKEFNPQLFEELCNIQCTELEIAAVMGMSIELINQNCNRVYGRNFLDVFAEKREGGRTSLRRAQWKSAIEGKNTIMQIFLGKNMLGQTDRQEIEHTGKNGSPIQVSFIRAETDTPS